ncbi:MAG: endonuclease domain-containing protein [Oscillospiraceae bacterium]|nr:endonuclease domain-containing protein [Ruminococcus sp.]MCD8344457.1 endonuclease domain-containing protein [Oscillospiraceae bacterium]
MPQYGPVKKNNDMLDRAKELRKNMTPQEKKLWYMFLRGYPVKIYRQRIIESFIVDFYCSSARLVIEVDGNQHYTEDGLAYDRDRSVIIKRYHLKVLRFTNAQVDQEFNAVCKTIDRVIKQRIEMLKGDEYIYD